MGRLPAVYSLSHHANYACRHSGVCCTAGWTIPVDAERQTLLGVSELPQPPGVGCQFHDGRAHRCTVHRDQGEAAMPASCQHFPRRALIDDRGIFVTLSHFCPTAAAMLFESDDATRIVDAPAAFPASRDWDGLDARGQWPPLVSPGLLFDLDAYSAFEQFVVTTLAAPGPAQDRLEVIAGAVERLREWNQRRGSFAVWAAEAFALAKPQTVVLPGAGPKIGALLMPPPSLSRIYAAVLRAVPPHHEPAALHPDSDRVWRERVAQQWSAHATVVKRYLAAKGFASWTAYQGQGARTLVAEMAISELVLRAIVASACARDGHALDAALLHQSIREADWLLVHLLDRQPFVEWLGGVEHVPV